MSTSTDSRATRLIVSLGLVPHPEGGYFGEVYRSAARVQPGDERPGRSALTTIYFLLARDDVSRWHRVSSDEVWHFYEGDPLELFIADSGFDNLERHLLGPLGNGASPVRVVPANAWQAARSTGAYTLVGCTVAPGFEYADFSMLRGFKRELKVLRERHPELEAFA